MNAKAELLAKLSASVMNIPVRHCLAPVCCDDALLHFLFQCLKRDVLSLLPPLQIFQDCDPDFVEMCSKLMTIEKHHPNFVLCQLGDKGDRLWILTKGTVELRDSEGKSLECPLAP